MRNPGPGKTEMKRLVITGPRAASFEEVEIPACPQDGILVKARTTAISAGTELRVFRAQSVDEDGKFLHEWIPFSLPAENGYSMVGEVVEAAPGSTDLFGAPIASGDRVFIPAPHKEYAPAGAKTAVILPRDMTDEEASLLNILEVGHIALRRGNPDPGANVCIIGLGLIGLSALAYCNAFGFRTAALDIAPERLEVARRIGCDFIQSAETEDAISPVSRFFDDEGADLVIEAASSNAAVQSGLDIVRSKGTLVVVARHLQRPEYNPFARPYFGKQITLKTAYAHPPEGHRWDRRHSLRRTMELIRDKKLPIEPMITHRGDWTEIPEYYRRLDRGEPGLTGVVLRWDG